uniref:Uncharacterized protein n=1 Tax=Erythrolobus madagascarensis TaxID=708628 RepID=A0A7S0T706_9RHOD|mmetsp:Transcript_3052/g.6600  ORF Transcript_3052/g.6600 Transcript_3052/m.6600 type:complete len:324 (+) Transcript_3052:331-1302(+)|eukprot:CAMPEP_0185846192 /NCGR_PEP_ID=MMETSP1354-20130828/1907_1 /TAXON_ID=708628 /ORGANISM="Erythrolobus madagascarensis, Strain CCMP3276" /LENGTH=323 /DNA_ID=CAMNT_0028546283 /DNA_START=294 /DNA_END=1265 /DNA_ORIENTATION=+
MADEDDLLNAPDRARFPDVAGGGGTGIERHGTFAGSSGVELSGRAASFTAENLAQRGRSLPRGNTATRSFSLTRNSQILTNADFLIDDQASMDGVGDRSMSKADRDILFTSHRSKLEALFSGGQSEMSEAPVLEDVPDAKDGVVSGSEADNPQEVKKPPAVRAPQKTASEMKHESVELSEKQGEMFDRSRTGGRAGGANFLGGSKYSRESSGRGRKMPSLSQRLNRKGSNVSHKSVTSAPPLSPTSYRADPNGPAIRPPQYGQTGDKSMVASDTAVSASGSALGRQKTAGKDTAMGQSRNFSQKLQTIKARLTRGGTGKHAPR